MKDLANSTGHQDVDIDTYHCQYRINVFSDIWNSLNILKYECYSETASKQEWESKEAAHSLGFDLAVNRKCSYLLQCEVRLDSYLIYQQYHKLIAVCIYWTFPWRLVRNAPFETCGNNTWIFIWQQSHQQLSYKTVYDSVLLPIWN